jgi:E3 ubiquitin-protein ligase UBR2
VIKQEVSIHAPLTRLFAALYMHIDKFQLDFHSFYSVAKLHLSTCSPAAYAALKHDLAAEHKMAALLEPSLRSLVLVAQTNAGLWKRNGFSLLSQVYFYSNIKCRHDMFDRDVACLQMAASAMQPDEFLANLLAHYNLFEFYTE